MKHLLTTALTLAILVAYIIHALRNNGGVFLLWGCKESKPLENKYVNYH